MWKILRYNLTILSSLALLFFGILAVMVVPAPEANIAIEVTGTVVSITPPHPEYGDLAVVLEGGRRYYVNRANEIAYFAWQELLADVKPGDSLTLTVVNPLAWRLANRNQSGDNGPLAGIRTAEKVYLDASVAAVMWKSQATFQTYALIALVSLLLCLLPDLMARIRNRFPPHFVAA
jgi:hypothetical protein